MKQSLPQLDELFSPVEATARREHFSRELETLVLGTFWSETVWMVSASGAVTATTELALA